MSTASLLLTLASGALKNQTRNEPCLWRLVGLPDSLQGATPLDHAASKRNAAVTKALGQPGPGDVGKGRALPTATMSALEKLHTYAGKGVLQFWRRRFFSGHWWATDIGARIMNQPEQLPSRKAGWPTQVLLVSALLSSLPVAVMATPLHDAAKKGHTEEAMTLIKKGADVNARTEKGNSPLHFAADAGHTETAMALIEKGADVNAGNENGWTPLHFAAKKGHTETAMALIEKGADVNAGDEFGSNTPLHFAAYEGHTETAMALIEKGADVNARDGLGNTPLHWAATKKGRTETAMALIAMALIRKGADVNARNEYGWTPLHFAAYKGHTETAMALIEKGADVNAKNVDDDTPLHWAAHEGKPKTAMALIKKGADVNAKNVDDDTPHQVAAKGGHTEVAALLEREGKVQKRRTEELEQENEGREFRQQQFQRFRDTGGRRLRGHGRVQETAFSAVYGKGGKCHKAKMEYHASGSASVHDARNLYCGVSLVREAYSECAVMEEDAAAALSALASSGRRLMRLT